MPRAVVSHRSAQQAFYLSLVGLYKTSNCCTFLRHSCVLSREAQAKNVAPKGGLEQGGYGGRLGSCRRAAPKSSWFLQTRKAGCELVIILSNAMTLLLRC